MKDGGTAELREPVRSRVQWDGARQDAHAAAGFWLGLFFLMTQRTPWLARALKRPLVWLAVRCSTAVRDGTIANGRRILPAGATQKDLSRLTRGVLGSFYDFVCDIGQSLRMTRENWRGESRASKARQISRRPCRRTRGDHSDRPHGLV